MPSARGFSTLRQATPADIPALYRLAREAFPLDRFSADLLAEKLFRNPRPEQESYRTWLALRCDEPIGFMQMVLRPAQARGWVGMFAVDARCRRQGVATGLLEHVEAEMRAAGVKEFEVLAIPGNYFNPGLDPRYTEALCFLERRGFTRGRDCANLLAPLDEPFDVAEDERRLAAAGYEIRRASADEDSRLVAYFGEHFGPDWLLEARLAMANDPPALHLALRGGAVIAFSAHSSQNREWGFFGPMGTAPECRGTGIGRVLLLRCLNDLRAAGHRTSVIPWVGPIAFYMYHCKARVDRVFWRYHKTLA